jgi:hypothetical protein
MKKQDTQNPVLNLSFLNHYPLEEDIYSSLDKLQALCNTQTMLYSNNSLPDSNIRFHYSLIIEEQVLELRSLLDELFD